MQIYCLKCKVKTETTNVTESKTKNNRYITKGVCSLCGRNKSVFVCMHACAAEFPDIVSDNIASSTGMVSKLSGIASNATKTVSKIPAGAASGKGFSFNNLINSLPIELHQFAETGENIPEGSFNDQQNIHIVDRVRDTNSE